MDAWLISVFEASMSRSRVSPYAVARFLFVGVPVPFLLAVAPQLTQPAAWVVLIALATVYLLPMEYRDTYFAEQENQRGFVNSKKFGNPLFRLVCMVSFFVQVGVAMGAWYGRGTVDPFSRYHFALAAFWFLFAAALYLGTLNWMPPPKREARFWHSRLASAFN